MGKQMKISRREIDTVLYEAALDPGQFEVINDYMGRYLHGRRRPCLAFEVKNFAQAAILIASWGAMCDRFDDGARRLYDEVLASACYVQDGSGEYFILVLPDAIIED